MKDLPESISTGLVAQEGFKTYVGEHMGLEAVRAAVFMVASGPGALKGETGSALPGGRKRDDRKNNREFPNIGGASG